MGVFQFQVRLQGVSGLPHDVYENVLFYDVNLPDTVQGTCDSLKAKYIAANFLAGANSIFTGDKLLTAGNAGAGADAALFGKLGLEPMTSEEPARVAAE